jgi:hypothetical protein
LLLVVDILLADLFAAVFTSFVVVDDCVLTELVCTPFALLFEFAFAFMT